MPTEQERALEYRRQQQAREDHKLAQEQVLKGSDAAKAALDANWNALRTWEGWDPERKVEDK